MTTNSSTKLCLALSGSYESLKQFVSNDLQLKGIWEQPRRDRKRFISDKLTVRWRKDGYLLSLEGERATDFMKDLYRRICDCYVNGLWVSSSPDPQQLNDPAVDVDVYTNIEELKLGLKLNGKAILTLSLSVSEMASQFHTEKMDINNSTSTKASQTCIITQTPIVLS